MKSKALVNVLCSLVLTLGIATNSFAQNTVDTVQLKANVTCQGCKNKIEKNMGYEKGVSSVTADFTTKIVTVVYKIDKTNPDALSTALTKFGYENSIMGAQNATNTDEKTEKDTCKQEKTSSKKHDHSR